MKRRDFLVSAAALSLFASEAVAAKKQNSTKPAAGKPSSAKPASSKKKGAKPASGQSVQGGRHSYRPASSSHQGAVTHTAEDSVIEKPPQGTSASRLPPVRAAEPPSEWRTFEITTTVNLKSSNGQSKLWLPLPLNQDTLFQRTLGHSWGGNPNNSSMRRLPDGNLEVFHCEWKDSGEASLQLTTLVTTADRHFDVTKRTIAPEREDILRRNLQASQLIPNDGLAFQLGERIVGRIKDPVAQAKAIYDWVVDNSIYDPQPAWLRHRRRSQTVDPGPVRRTLSRYQRIVRINLPGDRYTSTLRLWLARRPIAPFPQPGIERQRCDTRTTRPR